MECGMAGLAWFRDIGLGLPAPLRRVSLRPSGSPVSDDRLPRQTHHRTIFISDVHLGTRACKADMLADFLAANSCDTLYLVGDIVDGWRLKHRWFWPEAHSRVLGAVLEKVDRGTRVIYVPGNHDEVFRDYCGRVFAGVQVSRETVHVTADGKRLLVLHGDRFDAVIAYAKWLALLGDRAYSLAVALNEWCHVARRVLGLEYWSLSAFLKQKVKNALEYICRFEDAVAGEARARGVDGVVCGHIHHAAAKVVGGVLYLNDGDWVESCTALVENRSGQLEILCWAGQPAQHCNAALPASEDIPVPVPA